MAEDRNARSRWQPVKDLMGKHEVKLGQHVAYQMLHSPRKVLYAISYYKFAAKMIGENSRILDIGCGEGMGTWVLAKECGYAFGVDIDGDAIKVARENWGTSKTVGFREGDFFDLGEQPFDAAVSFDVIEHILPENTKSFMSKLSACLSEHGIAIIGTPNITSDIYASPVTKAGHVNLFSNDRLATLMKEYFRHVFMFGANDEVVHTGFPPLCHYLIAVGCGEKR